ncbi:MAG TPA: PQQ-dependent sugar dehydrogenase [Baekduia sp.]
MRLLGAGRSAALLFSVLAALVVAAPAGAAPAGAPVRLLPVGTFDKPVGVVFAPGDTSRLFVVERGGRIVERHGSAQSTFADLTDRVDADGGEQGLLGLAFAPDYATSGKLYVYYTAHAPAGALTRNGGADLVVSELRRADADHVDLGSERVLLRIPHRLDQYENGGQLRFGPDGDLWIGTGDGGGDDDTYANAQRLDPATDDADAGADALLGKLLRIDPAPGDGCGGACTIPADNPGFPQREVWAYGLRNPWRFSFDRLTGDLALADVGNTRFEEIDLGPTPDRARGQNFGWPLIEGTETINGSAPAPGCCTMPVIERSHTAPDDYDAIIGGPVVRDPGLPALNGRYLYADFATGVIRSARFAHGTAFDDRPAGLTAPWLTSFGEDGCGRVYVTTLDGALLRLSQGEGACDAVGVTLTAPPRQRAAGGTGVRATLTCATACRASVRASLRVSAAVVGRTATRSITLAAGGRSTVKLKVNAATRAALRRALARGRKATAVVVVTARAPAGGASRRATVTARVVR